MVDILSDLLKNSISAFNAYSTSATADFGSVSSKQDIATSSVSATWVTGTTKLLCFPAAISTSDHDPEDYAVEAITAYPTNIQVGVGFDVIARAPNTTWGKYIIHIIGVV